MSQQLTLGDVPRATPAASRVIRFSVIGTPRPQGSTRAFIPKGWSRAVITTDNTKLKPWRQEISATALSLGVQPFARDVPVEVTLRFYFTRPKSATPKKRPGMTTRPDGDKLLRACLDSLTGILFEDDAQVIEFHCRKVYGGPERCEFEIREAIV